MEFLPFLQMILIVLTRVKNLFTINALKNGSGDLDLVHTIYEKMDCLTEMFGK